MQVVDFSDKYIDYVAKCTHDDNPASDPVRVEWIRKALAKGAVIKVALDDSGKPVGFIHAIPIEWAWYVKGMELYFIPCICVHYLDVYEKKTGKGRGRAMLDALEDDLRTKTKGIAVTAFDNDFWFMPYTFFKKMGFKEVKRDGDAVLMVKQWADAPRPDLFTEKYIYRPIEGKIAVDMHYNSICPRDVKNTRETCAEFPCKVILREFDAGFGETKVGHGVYVNGVQVPGREGDGMVLKETLRAKIESIIM